MKISLTELRQIFADDAQILSLAKQIEGLLIERAALKQQMLDLLADDAAKQAKVEAAFQKSEVIEARMRTVAGTPAV